MWGIYRKKKSEWPEYDRNSTGIIINVMKKKRFFFLMYVFYLIFIEREEERDKREGGKWGREPWECIHNQRPWEMGPTDMTATWECPKHGRWGEIREGLGLVFCHFFALLCFEL